MLGALDSLGALEEGSGEAFHAQHSLHLCRGQASACHQSCNVNFGVSPSPKHHLQYVQRQEHSENAGALSEIINVKQVATKLESQHRATHKASPAFHF